MYQRYAFTLLSAVLITITADAQPGKFDGPVPDLAPNLQPVPNLPYSAENRITSTHPRPHGQPRATVSVERVCRDSLGRTRKERFVGFVAQNANGRPCP